MEEPVIRCPKCNSSQIVANKKGFSGKKAVAGALLTGGIGLLAGTIGSKDIIITCLACGHEFKPGDGVPQKDHWEPVKEQMKYIENRNKPEFIEETTLYKIKNNGKDYAIIHYQAIMKSSKEDAEAYVEKLIIDNKIDIKAKEGCFVATACYGDYEAPEVIELRKFRDLKLARNYWGRVFIKTYYSLSPTIASWISQSNFIKKVVRKLVLNPIIKLVKIEES